MALGSVIQRGGKTVTAFALEGDWDTAKAVSNTFACEFPPKSGKWIQCPEIDRAAWFSVPQALEKIIREQRGFIERLISLLK